MGLARFNESINEKIEKVRNDSIEISYLEEIQDVLINYNDYNERMKNKVKIAVTDKMSKKYVPKCFSVNFMTCWMLLL